MAGKKPTATKKRTQPKAKPTAEELTPKQALFAMEYILDWNGAEAAVRAGYSRNSAASQASRLLTNVNVLAFIERQKAERLERLNIDADQLLLRLVREVNADILELFDDNNALKPVSEWPLIWRTGLIAGLDNEELYEYDAEGNKEHIGTVRKIKFSDRLKRLEMIGRHIKIQAFKDVTELKPSDALTELFKEVSGSCIGPGGKREGAAGK